MKVTLPPYFNTIPKSKIWVTADMEIRAKHIPAKCWVGGIKGSLSFLDVLFWRNWLAPLRFSIRLSVDSKWYLSVDSKWYYTWFLRLPLQVQIQSLIDAPLSVRSHSTWRMTELSTESLRLVPGSGPGKWIFCTSNAFFLTWLFGKEKEGLKEAYGVRIASEEAKRRKSKEKKEKHGFQDRGEFASTTNARGWRRMCRCADV